MTDIRIRYDGMYLFIPETQEGEDFLRDEIKTEPWMWLGSNLCVGGNAARDIAGLAMEAGLTVS